MKIAIVADTHDNWANFSKAIKWINKEKIQVILHCGDIQSQDTIDDAIKSFDGAIQFVKGNGDWGANVPDFLELEIDGKKIGMVHFPAEAKKMDQSKNFDMVFYGHTHKPWDEKIGTCHMINPGELAGQFYKPTFAVYDTDTGKMELKILEKL